jgi:hypothetical protein
MGTASCILIPDESRQRVLSYMAFFDPKQLKLIIKRVQFPSLSGRHGGTKISDRRFSPISMAHITRGVAAAVT